MPSIRVIYDGKTFVPQQPVSYAAGSELLFDAHEADREAAMERLNAQARADYEKCPSDEEDEAWARATERDLHHAWDED